MMYVNEPSLKELRENLLKFYESALPRQDNQDKHDEKDK